MNTSERVRSRVQRLQRWFRKNCMMRNPCLRRAAGQWLESGGIEKLQSSTARPKAKLGLEQKIAVQTGDHVLEPSPQQAISIEGAQLSQGVLGT